MKESKQNQMLAYFEHEIAECVKREALLQGDCRQDEANLEKIKANVFDIFRTMFNIAVRTVHDKDNTMNSIRCSFMTKVESIPANWLSSYERAKAHQDTSKILIEEIKLQTVAAIRSTFEEIWGCES